MPGRPETGDADTFPGQRFGLPEEGSGSVASIGRRLLALLLDWLLCTLIALAVFHSRWWTLPIFAAETYLLTALTGFTVGKRVLGIMAGWRHNGRAGPWAHHSAAHACRADHEAAAAHRRRIIRTGCAAEGGG
jgi:hypothetical protein